MERYNLANLVKKIYDSNFSFFTLKTLSDILGIKKEASLFSIIKKLVKSEVLTKIEKNKYLLKGAKIHDFALANFLYLPSYISFESALNFYGILSQFPYEISSATLKKTFQKKFEGKLFIFIHIKKDLYFGYTKRENFLIALPEKALLDQLYLWSKGWRGLNLDEYDLGQIKISRLKEFLRKYPKTKQFEKAKKLLKKFLPL